MPYRKIVEPTVPPSEGHGASGPELMQLMRQQAVNFGTRIVTDDIVKVDLSRRPFKLTSLEGQTIEAKAVIVATGARANYLGLPSEDNYKNHGVSACAVCDGALPRFRNKPLVVVGGGDSAVEEGTYLTKFASTVFLVHRRDQLRASKIMQQRALSNKKITPKWNRALAEVLGTEKDGVTGVRLKSTVDTATEEIPVSGVFLAIGHTPNTDFLAGQLKLDDKGYILWTTAAADEYQRRGCLRGRRRGRQLLQTGRDGRGHRLHGGTRRRALVGRTGRTLSRRFTTKARRTQRKTKRRKREPAFSFPFFPCLPLCPLCLCGE